MRCGISYDDAKKKVNIFQVVRETNRALGSKVKKETKFYKAKAVPIRLFECESWITTIKDETKIQAAEMRYSRRVGKFIRRVKRNNNCVGNF